MKQIICFVLMSLFLATAVQAGSPKFVHRKDMVQTWPFLFEGGALYCQELEAGRKAVWINGSDGFTYAINGQAIDKFGLSGKSQSKGSPYRLARDHATKSLSPIIDMGLKLCR